MKIYTKILILISFFLAVGIMTYIILLCNKSNYTIDFKTIHSKNDVSSNRTKTIHITTSYIDIIPEKTITIIKNRYTEYEVEIYSNESCRDFLYNYYPQEVVYFYDMLEDGKYKNIFGGLCILYIYGGVYIDIHKLPYLNNYELSNFFSSIDDGIIISSKLNNKLKYLIQDFMNNKNILDNYDIEFRKFSDILYTIHNTNKPIDSSKIDIPIFYINMDKSIDRRRFIEQQLRYVKVPITRVKGVEVSDFLMKKYKKGTKRGAVGCFLAHINAMKLFLNTKDSRCLIFEDDACFGRSSIWSLKLSEITTSAWLSQGTTAYIISRNCAKKFIELSKNITDVRLGIDSILSKNFGNNSMNEWSNYKVGEWKIFPYIYPASHLFKTEIQGYTSIGYENDCKRSINIIRSLGGCIKQLSIYRQNVIEREGSSIIKIIVPKIVDEYTFLSIKESRKEKIEIYAKGYDNDINKNNSNIKFFLLEKYKPKNNIINVIKYRYTL